jgi:hypothetical protein
VSERDRLEVEVWLATIPLPRVVETVIGAFASTSSLVVLLRDGEGLVGAGCAGLGGGDADRASTLAARLLEACGPTLGGLLAVERHEERLPGARSDG